MLFYIKHNQLFSVNEGPQKGWVPRWGFRGGLDPALIVLIIIAILNSKAFVGGDVKIFLTPSAE